MVTRYLDTEDVQNIFTFSEVVADPTLSVGVNVLITNNANNEVFISRQASAPEREEGFPLAQGDTVQVVAKGTDPVWVSGARGDIIIQRAVEGITPYLQVDLPSNVYTSKNDETKRLQVDVAETGFEEGREFRINQPLSISTSSRYVLKFSASSDFRILLQTLFSDAEGLLFRAYRASQGTESGTFNTSIPVYSNNFESSVPSYSLQSSITTGGDFTPNGGENPVETIRLRVSNATGQATTVGGGIARQRGLPAGDYYLVITNLTGAGTATGVYTLEFEERPSQFT